MDNEILRLKTIAYSIRKEIVKMTHKAQSGHPGGSLSCIDILTCLYFKFLKHNPKDPLWEGRDYFILSKGHASPALYGVLAFSGYFDISELLTFRQLNSRLQGHPERVLLPGVEITTGSLGQGVSVANGIAIGLKLLGLKNHVFCLIGDGEMQEGQIWEAIHSAGHRQLDNLTVILDRNGLQIDGKVEEIKREEPLIEKLNAFLWQAKRIDGHNYEEIVESLNWAINSQSKPTFIIANTIKGKGVSFMENNVKFHGVAPNDSELENALKELDEKIEKIEC